MNTWGSPLAQLLIGIAEAAPPKPKAHLRARLLPSDQHWKIVLDTSNSLATYMLLKLYTAPMALYLQQLVPTLLFENCPTRDLKRFMRKAMFSQTLNHCMPLVQVFISMTDIARSECNLPMALTNMDNSKPEVG